MEAWWHGSGNAGKRGGLEQWNNGTLEQFEFGIWNLKFGINIG
jgi:hypothetical protein